MKFSDRFWLYLYSNRNIAGSLLALGGLSLYFLNIIDSFWYLIVPGLYLVGALGFPTTKKERLQLQSQITAKEIRKELNNLTFKIRRKVSKPILQRVKSIKESIFVILPFISDINSSDPNVFVIRRTALEYLPKTLENYLKLPPAYAKFHPVRDGKTAEKILEEQLEILDREMKEMVIDISKNDVQAMLAHGRFLEEKFNESELLSI
ncbi:MAG: hypothetical protein QNJ45_00830 [Ardenticatenaceae bacterium]|nr:hypothetical protein [Ardenticatenaceae bacterium]